MDNKDYVKIGKLDEKTKLSWTFLDGSTRKAVVLENVAIGKGEYLPGWRWSKDVGKMSGKKSEAHVGYVVSGEMMLRGPDGTESKVGPGEAFEISSGHDAWVVGDVPCVALDFEDLRNKNSKKKT